MFHSSAFRRKFVTRLGSLGLHTSFRLKTELRTCHRRVASLPVLDARTPWS